MLLTELEPYKDVIHIPNKNSPVCSTFICLWRFVCSYNAAVQDCESELRSRSLRSIEQKQLERTKKPIVKRFFI